MYLGVIPVELFSNQSPVLLVIIHSKSVTIIAKKLPDNTLFNVYHDPLWGAVHLLSHIDGQVDSDGFKIEEIIWNDKPTCSIQFAEH